jgi:hypothetical protein
MIRCDICANIIMGGYENEGGFPAPPGFKSKAVSGKEKIENTCVPCGTAIRIRISEAVESAINSLRS